MATASLNTFLKRLTRGMAAETLNEKTDRQLVEWFLARREEAALEAIVRRHGAMVYRVCWRVLRQPQDAEDAFQATFLVLAQKLHTVRNHDSLASWLHGVAHRVALQAKGGAASRRRHEQRATTSQVERPADLSAEELLAVLDTEVGKLPDRWRLPLILCYLQGRTQEESASQLGWSKSTLRRRLEEARDALGRRLKERGIVWSAALSAVLLSDCVASAAPATRVVASTVKAAAGVAAGKEMATVASAKVEALTEGVLKMTLMSKLKVATVAMLLAVASLGTAVMVARATAEPPASQPPGADKPPAEGVAKVAEGEPPITNADGNKEEKPSAPLKNEFAVAGTVIGADGKPVADAQVAVIGLAQPLFRGNVGYQQYETLGTGKTDKEGRFRFDCVAESSSRVALRQVLASAPKQGLGWQRLQGTGDNTDVVVKLAAEQVVRGRLINLQGQPIKGAKLHVSAVGPAKEGSAEPTAPPAFGFTSPPKGLDRWPVPLTTDGEGRFVIHGLPRDMSVSLLVNDERFARQQLVVQTTAKGKPEEFEEVLEQARMLEGKVLAEDTGKPIGKVLLSINAGGQVFREWTDEQGRFRFNCPPANGYGIYPYAPDGSVYLTRVMAFAWPKGKVKHEVELKLPRGVMVRGKVTEAGSDKPVAGAVVSYYVRDDNPLARGAIASWRTVPGEFVQTRADGTFEAAVYPGKGHLMVKGPTPDYVMKLIEFGELGPTADFMYTHAVTAVDLKPGADGSEVNFQLQRGVTIAGRVVDSDGKPVKQAVLFYHDHLRDDPDRAYQAYNFGHNLEPVSVKDGRFELTGCNPKKKLRVVVLDRKNQIGALATLSPEEQKAEPTIRLEPCAKATFRCVDEKGKPFPIKRVEDPMFIVLNTESHDPLHQFVLLGLDQRYLEPDEKGRVTVPGLIPGADYRARFGTKEVIKAEAGKTHDLGDFVLGRRSAIP